MRHALLFLIITIVYVSVSSGQQAVIKGTVVDDQTLEAMDGVHVILGDGRGTVTDRNGRYLIKVSPGMLVMLFHYVGYKTQKEDLTVKAHDTVRLDIMLVSEVSEIDEIVVSPGRSAQKISELTVSTNIIKPEAITENHIINPEDIINQTSGIEIMDGQASIRGGSGYSYGVGSRVLVLIDGVPALSADAGNVKWSFLPLENLAQIEVIKGASSVLYGSSALNGIINLRTLDAEQEPVTRLSVTSGIYGSPRNKKWTWWNAPRAFTRASVSHSKKYGNTGVGVGGRLLFNNGYRRLNDEKLATVNIRLKRDSEKTGGLSYGVYVNAGYTVRTDFILWEDADSGALRQNESTANEFNGLSLMFDPFVSFEKEGRFKHDFRMRIQHTRNKLPESPQNNSDATSSFAEYQLWYKLFEKLDIIAGTATTYSKIVSNFHGDHQGLNLAGYAQLDYRPVTRLKLIGGLRVEHNSLDGVNDKTIAIFRTGINYHAGRMTFIRASFGQGYRYPSIAEKFATTTVGAVRIFPNPDIKPESGWSSELGIKQGLSTQKMSGQVDLSLFYTQNTDLIEYMFGIYPDPVTQVGDFGFRAVNTEHSRVYGFEIETALTREFGPVHSSVRAGYAFMYPVEYNKATNRNTGIYLKYRRKNIITLTSITSFRKFDFGLNLFYRSKILNIDDVFLNPLTRESLLPGFYEYWLQNNNGYILVDGYITYRFGDTYAISLGVKNIGNAEYMGRPGDIQPQRHYSLQFSGRF